MRTRGAALHAVAARGVLLVAAFAANATATANANATELALRVEPGAAIPVGGPVTGGEGVGVGGGGVAKAGLSFASGYLDLQAGAGAYAFAGNTARVDQSTLGAVTVGGGARVQRPHMTTSLSPWADVDMLYVRTGPLDRPGFAAGGGVSFALDEKRATWLGPFVRYLQIVEPEKTGYDTADARIVILGVGGELGGGHEADRDHDGIDDAHDRCPDVAGVAMHDGCPIVDGDGDGTPDAEDACKANAGPVENKGCPYPDADGDGVLDKDDACPHERGTAQSRGCPVLDADHDGFADADDRCPNESGPVHGCPDPDGDGIVPPDDQCPNVSGSPDDHGCPKYKQIVVTDERIQLTQKIFFAFGKTLILSQSYALLDEVAQAMKDNPSLRVRVEGHTDSTGDAKKNVELSQGRADAVVAYLVEHGVDKSRFVARGFGSEVPLDTNKTAEGRERNRRVEFVIVNEKDTPISSVKKSTTGGPK